MKVDRCICMDIPFEDVKACAEREGLDVRGVVDRLGCGCACGMCVPYIRLVLRTGQTELPVLDEQTFRALAAEG